VLLDGFHDHVGAAAAELARCLIFQLELQLHSTQHVEQAYRSANLHEEFPYGVPIVHGVECGNLVDAHGWDLEDIRYFIHDTDARVSMLPLAEIEQGHDGRLLVLRGVSLEDLIDEGEV
jgi:hypothetical protein